MNNQFWNLEEAASDFDSAFSPVPVLAVDIIDCLDLPWDSPRTLPCDVDDMAKYTFVSTPHPAGGGGTNQACGGMRIPSAAAARITGKPFTRRLVYRRDATARASATGCAAAAVPDASVTHPPPPPSRVAVERTVSKRVAHVDLRPAAVSASDARVAAGALAPPFRTRETPATSALVVPAQPAQFFWQGPALTAVPPTPSPPLPRRLPLRRLKLRRSGAGLPGQWRRLQSCPEEDPAYDAGFHIKDPVFRVLWCNVCKYSSYTRAAMQTHLFKHHGEEDKEETGVRRHRR